MNIMRKKAVRLKEKIVTIAIVCMLLLISSAAFSISSVESIGIRKQYNDAGKPAAALLTDSLSVDLKVRKSGDTTWQDSISANVGTKLEFKISITSSSVEDVMVVIQFPRINDELILKYVVLSASVSPLPIPVDDVVVWGFPDMPPSEITFKAEIKKSETGPVNLNAGGNDTSNSQFVEDDDSVQVTGSGCCFPAGTKITMADGTIKNIEDIKLGDSVLSYNIEQKEFTSWIVKMLSHPVHPVYDIELINGGLVQVTVDHPFYIKKPNSRIGWGAIDATRSKDSITLQGDVLTLEVGDYLFTSDEQWIKVTNIVPSSEPTQTYNILSFSGTKTYFANGILVYEEHPSYSYTNARLEKILEKHPLFTKIILSLPFFHRLLNAY
jgi:hypothetical protein